VISHVTSAASWSAEPCQLSRENVSAGKAGKDNPVVGRQSLERTNIDTQRSSSGCVAKIVRDDLGQASFTWVMIHAAFNPKISLMNWTCPTTSPFGNTAPGPFG
jgi:hypothetical protein